MTTEGERVARLEEQNEQCAADRENLRETVEGISKLVEQVRGGVRLLVVLFTILTAGVWGDRIVSLVSSRPAAAEVKR